MNSLFADPVAEDMDGGLFISRRAGKSLEVGLKWEEAAQGHDSTSEIGAEGAEGQTRSQKQTAKEENLISFVQIYSN